MDADRRYEPPSALEVAWIEPEVFPSVEVKEVLDDFEEGWAQELQRIRDEILADWDALGRERGGRDLMDAARRGNVQVSELQPFVEARKEEALARMEANRLLFSWTVTKPDGTEARELPLEERRDFASQIISRYLTREFNAARLRRVIVLQSTEVPAGVELLHRLSGMRNVA